jgi:ribosome-interacting GTPase 1
VCDTGSRNFHGRRRLDTANTANNTDSMGVIEKIKEIEAEMARTQKNKATEYHLGQLKAKLAKLRTELQEPAGKSGGGEQGFEVQKFGDGRVALIGFPSVGKSTLLSKLTGTDSEAAAYEFTTLTCVPGTIHMRGTKIQMLDLPGIIEGASEGKGRGRQVIAVCKSADLLLMVLDAGKPHYHKEILTKGAGGVWYEAEQKAAKCDRFRKKKTRWTYGNEPLVPQSVVDDKMVQRYPVRVQGS